jgi:hypothetical protein
MKRTSWSSPGEVGTFGVLAPFLIAAGVLAALATSAPAEVIRPVLALGPTTVRNGTAEVSGTVGAVGSGVELTINVRRAAIDGDGRFAARVKVDQGSAIRLVLRDPLRRRTTTTSVPLAENVVSPRGLISPGVLWAIEEAGVMVLEPPGGFEIVGRRPLRVEVSVRNPGHLAALVVNGTDMLHRMGPGNGFTARLRGTSREVRITVTDLLGVSQTTALPIAHTTSTP